MFLEIWMLETGISINELLKVEMSSIDLGYYFHTKGPAIRSRVFQLFLIFCCGLL